MAHWGLFLVVGPSIFPQQGPGFCAKVGLVYRAPRLEAPGPDRFMGVLGSWSRRNWLLEAVEGIVIFLGKPGEAMSAVTAGRLSWMGCK